MNRRKGFGALVLIGILLVGAIGIGIVSTTITSGQATTTQAIHFSKLIEFLPAHPSGWVGEEPEGKMYGEEGPWSKAGEVYTKSGTEDVCSVVIIDFVTELPEWHEYGRYAKTVTVKGFPAYAVYAQTYNGGYGLFVNLSDRFLVSIKTNSDRDTLYAFANAIDYKGIAALGRGAAPPTETEQPTGQPAQSPTAETPTTPTGDGKAP